MSKLKWNPPVTKTTKHPPIVKKFGKSEYKRTISANTNLKDAKERARAYRFFSIPARVVKVQEKGKKPRYYTYVPKKDLKWINSKMIPSYRL